MKSTEIVIIGGGFAGVRAAKDLARWSGASNHNLHITLIDKGGYHNFTPLLYEAASAHVPEIFGHSLAEFNKIKMAVAYPLDDLFFDDINIAVVRGEAEMIDFKKKSVQLTNNEIYEYDFLVVATGSETNYFKISGLNENAYELKTVFDALSIRNAIDEAALNVPKRSAVRVVVAGGGFTGCEVAAELIGYFARLSKLHGRPDGAFECTVVEASDRLLGGTSGWVDKNTRKRFARLGVKLLLNSPVKKVEKSTVLLGNKLSLPYDILIWVAGVKASSFAHAVQKVEVKKKFCLSTDPYLRVSRYKEVFSAGDVVYCIDEKTGKCLPMTAQVAWKQGKSVAENIIKLVLNKPLKKYKPSHGGYIIPLGGRYALLDAYGFKLSGYLPWLIKQAVEFNYWCKLIGIKQAWRLSRRSTAIFTQNDKI